MSGMRRGADRMSGPGCVKVINIMDYYHAYFITKTQKREMCPCAGAQDTVIEIDCSSEFFMVCAEIREFYETDFTK